MVKQRRLLSSMGAVCSMVGMAAFAMIGTAAELPPLELPVCDEAPVLDGKLDDQAWQKAATIENLYLIKTRTPAPETSFRLMRDNTWLYIAAHCRNPNMPHVTQSAHEHDGPVVKDDSLETLVRPVPAEGAPHYHFMLSFANVGREQRCNQAGLRDSTWNPPWRTVTRRQEDGWTAEIAVPWFAFGVDDLGGMQINLCRNLASIEVDAQGKRQKGSTLWHTLRPGSTGSFHDFANVRAVSGMGGFKPAADFFAPQVVGVAVTGVRKDEGANIYDLKVGLDTATPVAGRANLTVMEDFGEGEVEALRKSVSLEGPMELELGVPAGDLQARRVRVVLRDPVGGRLLAERVMGSPDLAGGVVSKDRQPFYRKDGAPRVRSATMVVAAADSPGHVKSQADFVCAGLDDHIVVNAAIDALPATGGKVHLAAGTFSIGGIKGTHGGISIFRSNVVLTGEGSGTRLILQDGLTDINAIWIAEKRGVLVSDVTVRDLFIDGNAENQVPWARGRAGWNGGNGIKSTGISGPAGPTPCNIRVENCHIENCQLMAVMLTGEAVEVHDCYFTGNFGSHVIELLGDSGRIDGCTLRVKDGDSVGYGFSTDHSHYYHISNNKILVDEGGRIRGHPINNWPAVRYGPRTNLYHGVIAENMVINNGKSGPVLIDGYMDMVHNNIFRNVPVVIGGPQGGMGVTFEHNMLINSPLKIKSPLRGPECRIFVNGNQFFNSSVTHEEGNVVWGTNPGYVPEKPAKAGQ